MRNKTGLLSYLTITEESYFVALLALLPDYGFQVTYDVALQLANDYCKLLGLSSNPGKKGSHSFVRRHHDGIKWVKQNKLERILEESFTEEVRSGWFTILESVMTKYNPFDKSNQVFNVDETDFSDKTKGKYS